MTQGSYIILGATSAMAVATARRLAGNSADLALVARDQARLDELADDLTVRGASRVNTYSMDLVRDIDPQSAYARIADELGPIAGILVFYGVLGDQERAEHELDHALDIIDVNFRSAAAWTLAGAQILEDSPADNRVLIGISSVAGDRGRQSNFVYGAAKGGFSTLLQGLAHKWAGTAASPRAVAIKLGFVDTPMTAHIENRGGPLWATPEMIAAVVDRALTRGGPVVYGPWFWRWIMLIVRALPPFVFNKVRL